MDARKDTRGDSCCSAFEYQVLLRVGGRMFSSTEETAGGAAREFEATERKGETGRETT